jgi:hypothetical protein
VYLLVTDNEGGLRMRAGLVAFVLAGACVASMLTATTSRATPQVRRGQLVDLEPLGPALRAFEDALAAKGVGRLAATAARAVKVGQKVHVKQFAHALSELYISQDTWEEAFVSAACAWIETDWDKYGPQKRTPKEWTDDLYSTMGIDPNDPLWNHFGRSNVEKWVRQAEMAYYSPQTARGYYLACGRKR